MKILGIETSCDEIAASVKVMAIKFQFYPTLFLRKLKYKKIFWYRIPSDKNCA